jgi:hypothetical protein
VTIAVDVPGFGRSILTPVVRVKKFQSSADIPNAEAGRNEAREIAVC